MKSRQPAGGRAPRARWGPLLTGRGHSLAGVSSGAHISHHAMTAYKKGGKLRPAQVTRNRVYLREQNCMWNTQTQVSNRRVCRLRAGCFCGQSARGESPARSRAASFLTGDGQRMLADAGWLEHKAQSSANWQFREVSLIVCNRHLPEGASTSFPRIL